ncbi:hypothetical protein [Burkholderia metallica]|uniref:hypothetical protein n=1 Tax=Burkholderia metallica TaxID=488729 RepID=UPI001582C005|nr:hypothetical protein [Burkholderia metallica]
MADTIRYCDAMVHVPALWHDVENDQPVVPRCRAGSTVFDVFDAGAGRAISSPSRSLLVATSM